MTESGDPVMTESEQAQAPTPRIMQQADDIRPVVLGYDEIMGCFVLDTANERFLLDDEDSGERLEALLNALQTSLSEANAEVTRLRGALEEIVHRARPSALSSPPDEDMERIARAALAREEPVAREVCPYCMTSTGGEVRNPDCPVHGFQPLVREENP
jgi:hypothetical protein